MANLTLDIPHGDCILFATADWDEPYWTNKQHAANELAKLGWRVLYIESVGLRSPGTGSSRDWMRLKSRFWKGLKSLFLGAPQRSPGIWVLSPLMVPSAHNHLILGKINRWLLRLCIWRTVVQKRFTKPLIWTYHPYMLEIVSANNSGPLLYHCVDDLAAVPGVDAEGFRQTEELLLSRADIVFATAKTLADHCSIVNPNTYFLPNVVDTGHFGRAMEPGIIPADLKAIPEPRLGYHGVLSDFKLDFQLVLDCAVIKPEWQWVFIGDEREGQKNELVAKLALMPNVHFLGYRRYEELPNYLRGINIGLLPSKLNKYTRSMFPMKYYEYLAAGLPVVATPLDFTKTHLSGLQVGNTPEEFCNAIAWQLNRGRFSEVESIEMVGDNTWHARTRKMLHLLFKRK